MQKTAKRLSRQPLLFQLFVRFRENRPIKDYSCKISDGNSNSFATTIASCSGISWTGGAAAFIPRYAASRPHPTLLRVPAYAQAGPGPRTLAETM